MQRITPGTTTALTFPNVTTGGTYTAKVTDPLGRYLSASATETNGTATVTINADAFFDGASGFGTVQVLRSASGIKSMEASERVKFLPGIEMDKPVIDYRWNA